MLIYIPTGSIVARWLRAAIYILMSAAARTRVDFPLILPARRDILPLHNLLTELGHAFVAGDIRLQLAKLPNMGPSRSISFANLDASARVPCLQQPAALSRNASLPCSRPRNLCRGQGYTIQGWFPFHPPLLQSLASTAKPLPSGIPANR